MATLIVSIIVIATVLGIAFTILESWAKEQRQQNTEIKHLRNVVDHDHDAIRALRYDVDHQSHGDEWSNWTKPLNPDKDSHSAFDEKP